MNKYLVIVCCIFLLFSCSQNKKTKEKKAPLMYEPSEMALLMRQMYAYNKVLRQQIINNDSLSMLPKEFVNIHTAVMTDETERDSSYKALAKEFLTLQKAIYGEKDTKKSVFNKSITTCIQCHETRCAGPIPKIKRLLIN